MGKWVDLVVLIFLAFGLLKGFKRGLIRELFSLVGAILAIIIAFHSYQSFSLILLQHYQLTNWQAQAIAFGVLIVGISLLGAFFGFIWSKAVSYTPFAVLDRIGGAAFGVAKIGVVLLVLLIFVGAVNFTPINDLLDGSAVVQQIAVLLPFAYDYLDQYWPEEWERPAWLFPAGFSLPDTPPLT